MPQSIPCPYGDARHVSATLAECRPCVLSPRYDRQSETYHYVLDLSLMPSNRGKGAQLDHDLPSAAASIKATLQRAISEHAKQLAPEWLRPKTIVKARPR